MECLSQVMIRITNHSFQLCVNCKKSVSSLLPITKNLIGIRSDTQTRITQLLQLCSCISVNVHICLLYPAIKWFLVFLQVTSIQQTTRIFLTNTSYLTSHQFPCHAVPATSTCMAIFACLSDAFLFRTTRSNLIQTAKDSRNPSWPLPQILRKNLMEFLKSTQARIITNMHLHVIKKVCLLL